MKRLKFSDPSTKTKILLNAGIVNDRLDVSLLQLIVNGETFNTWGDYAKETIVAIDPDFGKLLSFNGCSLNGESLHYKADLIYFFKQARDQLGKDYYTQEDHNKAVKHLKSQIKKHKIFTLLKDKGLGSISSLEKYTDFESDLFKYTSPEKSFNHWKDQLSKRCSVFAWQRVEPVLKEFFYLLDELRDLEKKYRFKTLIRKDELWNIDRLISHTGLTYQTITACLVSETLDQDVADIADQIAQDRSFEIKMLIEKYDIK